jgi:FKBP-type peptidyl-prolyl cis-trans isomerase (trigger factor)
MKVAVKKVDALKRELNFEVSKDRVTQVLEEVYSDMGRVAKIKGVRPGKAPRHILENEHAALAREEALKKLIPVVYREGIEQEKIAPIDLPEIEDVEFKDGIVTFKAVIDIKPEVQMGNYKGISVKRKSSQVTEEEIEKTLDFFKKSQGNDQGKDVPLDDNFAKGLGYPNLDEFKQTLKRQMELDKDRSNRVDIENQIIEALLKEAKFPVPQSLVKKQLEHRLHHAMEQMRTQGTPEEDMVKKEAELRKALQKPVEKDVRVYLILDKIAELEGMSVLQNENLPAKVMEFLFKEAHWE